MSADCPPKISGLVTFTIEDATPTTPLLLTLQFHANVSVVPGLSQLEYIMNPDLSYAGKGPIKGARGLTVITVSDARLLTIGDDANLSLFDLLNQSGSYDDAISTAPGGNCANAEKTFTVTMSFTHDGVSKSYKALMSTLRGPLNLTPTSIITALEITSQSENLELQP